MKLNGKTILLVSPESWGHIFVSKHHYAIHLGKKNNKVYFLNPPTNTNSIKETEYKNVFSVDYTGFPKGMRFYPSILQSYLIQRKFFQLQKLCEVTFDIIWSFDNSVFYDFSKLPNSLLKISHIVDLNQDFQFKKASSTASINFTTSRTVLSKQLKVNSNSHFINHGFAPHTNESINSELILNSKKIKVGYAGNLDIQYLDWKLLKTLIYNYKEKCDFYLAGNFQNQINLDWINSSSNCSYIGCLRSDGLPSFYSQMDILIICYQADHYQDQLSNPHKMMEYLGTGNMVVATKTLEYAKIATDSLIAMTDKNNEFMELFDHVLYNLDIWNSDDKRNKRINFALENTYDKQIERIEKILPAI